MSRPPSLRRDLSLGIVLGVAALWAAARLLAGAVLRHELNEVSDSALQQAAERILSIAVVEIDQRHRGAGGAAHLSDRAA